MKNLCLIVFFLLSIGCGPKTEVRSGQVFITLKNRQTVKLSLTQVSLIESNSAVTCITQTLARKLRERDELKKEEAVNTARLGTNWTALDKSETNRDYLNEKIKNMYAQIEQLQNQALEAGRRFTTAEYQRSRALIQDLQGQIQTQTIEKDKCGESMNQAKAERKSLTSASEDIAASLKRIDQFDFCTEATWPVLQTTITDADGHFTFRLPGAFNYMVLANSRRAMVEEEEKYSWLVPLEKLETLLHNGNLTTLTVAQMIPAKP